MSFLFDDDRPPIEVVAGSIRFCHGYRWKEPPGATDRKKWTPDHSNGHNVAAYEVEVGSVKRTGKKVAIDYKEDGTECRFRVEGEDLGQSGRFVPVVISAQPMDLDCDGLCISFGKKGSGRITGVAVDGKDLPMSGNDRVTVRPLRHRLSRKDVKRLLAVLLMRLPRLFDEDDEERPRRTGQPDRRRSSGKKPVRRSRKS